MCKEKINLLEAAIDKEKKHILYMDDHPLRLEIFPAAFINFEDLHFNQSEKIFSRDIFSWMESLIEKSQIQIDLFTVNTPDGVRAYKGCWVRDFTMLCMSNHPKITKEFILEGLNLFFKFQSKEGEVPDWVPYDHPEKTIYRLFNKWQFMDNHLWLIILMGVYLQKSGDLEYFLKYEQKLIAGLKFVNLSPNHHQDALVYVSPEKITANWGFTDTVKKTGIVLFCSILRFVAAKILRQVYDFLDRTQEQIYWEGEENKITEQILALQDSTTKLFFAASGIGRKVDIWGSAFGAYVGCFPQTISKEVCTGLVERKQQYYFHGHIRHLLKPDHWEAVLEGAEGLLKQPNQYQNGAYWGTPAGWIAYCYSLIDLNLAYILYTELLLYFHKNGIWECVTPYSEIRLSWIEKILKISRNKNELKKCNHYVASLALPFQNLRF